MKAALRFALLIVLLLGTLSLVSAQKKEKEDPHDHDHEGHDHEKENGHAPHEEDNHDHGDEHDDHEDEHHGHKRHADESASEHLVELYGGDGVVYEPELRVMFQELNDVCEQDDHAHAHDHGHGHGHKDDVVTPLMLVETFGKDGGLDAEGLEKACSTIMRCQLESGCELKSEGHDDDEDDEDVKGVKLVAALVLFAESVIGGVVPLAVGHFKKFDLWLSILNAFSGGVFLSTGFTHMLPHLEETEAEVSGLDEYPLGNVILVIGFMLVFFIEHILFDVHSSVDVVFRSDPQDVESKSVHLDNANAADTKQAHAVSKANTNWLQISNPLILLLAISVHALLEALALGLEDKRSGVLILFASIGSHKGVAAMALSARFIRNGATRKQVIGFMTAFALISPVGVGIGMASNEVSALAHLILNGLAAGTFIYVGAYEVIADEFHGKQITRRMKQIKYLAVVLGVTVISLLQLVPHGDH